MQTHELVAHPDHPPSRVSGITAGIGMQGPDWLLLRWRIEGAGSLVVPPFAGKGRADGLWQTTCFELFARCPGESSYAEFNFSPSERWAAYDFTGYRDGMANRDVARGPECTLRGARALVIFDVSLPLAALPAQPFDFGLAAVIEEAEGTRSYWAIAHSQGRPDFHDPACFAATFPATEAP